MHLHTAQINMLTQQLRTDGLVDEDLLSLFANLRREDFTPKPYWELAYADMMIPIGHEQVMLSPILEGRILQHTLPQPHESVLEIGTGTGYLTALLAQCARHVTSVDIFPEFTQQATTHLNKIAINNVSLHTANGARGLGTHTYDVIIISGAVELLDEALLAQVAPQGRVFAVIGKAPAMQACLLTHQAAGTWHTQSLFETVIPPLCAAPKQTAFNF